MAFKYHCLVLALCIITEALGQTCPVTTSWSQISGRLKHVSVGVSGVWGVNSNDNIYYRGDSYGEEESNTCAAWVQTEGALKQLDVGKNVVWGVNGGDNIYYREGISATNPTGADWVQVSGALKHVSVSQNGHVWGVNGHDQVYHRIGASNCNQGGDSWSEIGGRLKQISVGNSGVWGVNSGDNIYYRVGTYGDLPSDPDGTSWQLVSGALKYISSADMVYGVNVHDWIYYRVGVTPDTPTGSRWEQIGGRAKQVESLSCLVWVVNTNDMIYKKKTD
uniref:Repellent n=1 Tax=Solaster dawsoni TaxID=105863 RepID=H1A7C6_SOLDW|nr:repellent [Solaster dawsoni]